jgi:hypothetical protein
MKLRADVSANGIMFSTGVMYHTQPCTTAELFQLAAESMLGTAKQTDGKLCFASKPQWLVHAVQVGGPPEPPKSKEERKEDFYANVGDAIRTLREDVPTCLKSEMNCAHF